MTQDQWTAVDDYLVGSLLPTDHALEAALGDSTAAGLPPISVTANQGRMLQFLARMQGARRILEIGTLGGYSTIWLARALPDDGRLVTLEINPAHAEVAIGNLARAGLSDRVEVRLGRALDLLPELADDGPFDFAFIDADKPSNADYFEWAVRLSRPGSVIVVDNVVRNGRVIESASGDANVEGTRRLFDVISGDSRVEATAIQTVGSKGYDGFVLAVVTGP